ncbi:MAG: D-glycerate dehydrogenase [Gammaproteobacteria bacterium]|nr:D-glycerate dehydrogenase [Gammaproteobacteria bacterium]NIN61380.1 D-glycerate dehydrogenase [Gammaproteobacteria bacterium]NIO61147.1 D-glycerate dehydrogenase [Gammaproteobacteria bacterium]NIP48919.1 D-glycerate dehydrogenase [Gammaproteobacteria bacterium]NIQ09373.1 D-glycerate dehydrogenase [Gammaproteobacteria bacterium]
MSKPKVVITRRWPEAAEARAKELFDVVLNEDDHPMSIAELQEALETADAVCPTVSDQITAEVLGAEPMKCKILGNYGVGFNHIDLDAAKSRNLVVTNTPEVLTDCTADIAMILMLSVARRIGEGERHVRNKEWTGWRPTHMMGTKVTGKTLGLIGMGRIARAMAHKAHHGFGMKIIFTDPYPPPDEIVQDLNAESRDSIEDVLKDADFVSLHCPGGEETYHLLNEERIKMMKPGAFLINSARGDVIDPQALITALKNGSIAGAGLDVYEGEPNVQEEFLSMENVVLLPHLGSATIETRVAMGMRALDNVKAFFDGKEPGDRVA